MTLTELLTLIQQVSIQYGISTPYICGGVPRDKVLNRVNDFNDIDITTGDTTIHHLAKETAIKLGSGVVFRTMSDGHSRIIMGNLKLDFSSNFNVPGINHILREVGITNPTKMQSELYSRDFTCNTLLMSLNMDKILDITGLGVPDINNKILTTCLAPELTLGYDNKRIIRAIYLACKLKFDIDENVLDWISENPKLISNVKLDYLVKKLKKAVLYDKEKTIALLDSLKLWKYIPIIPELNTEATDLSRI